MIKAIQKYLVEINGKDVEFGSEQEALAALAKVQFAGRARAYVDQLKDKEGNPIAEKNKEGKFNVVLDFIAYEASLSAAPAAEAAEPTGEVESDTESF